MSKKERDKGGRYEREIANALKRIFPNARRKVTNHAGVENGVDLAETGNLYIQTKKWKRYPPATKINEIQPDDGIHVFVAGADYKPDLVVLYFEDFLHILEDVGIVYDD